MKKACIFLLCIFVSNVFSFSLFLINDSPFELIAVVQSADGRFIGQVSLQPGEQSQWSTDMQRSDLKDIYDAKTSLTPLTVIWKCSYEGYYSVCSNVSPGGVVKASQCDGSKSCKPKPKDDEKEKKEKEDRYCPSCPVCPQVAPKEKPEQENKDQNSK